MNATQIIGTKKRNVLLLCCMLTMLLANRAQCKDVLSDSCQSSLLSATTDTITAGKRSYSLDYRYLVAPTLCIGYGLMSLCHEAPQRLDRMARNRVLYFRPDRTKYDNYTQYAPAVLTYGLNLVGVKGRHNYRGMTIIYLTSQLFTGLFTMPIKMGRLRERPDMSNFHSFPSGHTTTAFSAAQFMYREYQDTHFWLAVSGSSFAFFSGFSRILNNKHWVSDVVIGAGLGILSTELAYWVYPTLDRWLTRKGKITKAEQRSSTLITPFFEQQGAGINVVYIF